MPAEDAPDLLGDQHARGGAHTVLLDDGRLLNAVEIADQIVPFDSDLVGSAEWPAPATGPVLMLVH